MRLKSVLASLALVLGGISTLGTAVAAPPAMDDSNPERRYIVQFRDFRGASAAVRAAGGNPVLELAPQSAVAAYLPPQAIEGLQRNPNVVLIEQDARRYPMAETTPYGITMVQAEQLSFPAGESNTMVCIIDSGYYTGHEDLGGNTVSGTSDTPAGNWAVDECGHGSHVAGTIAALGGNGQGVVGVIPGGLKLHAVQVFDGASCAWTYSSSLVNALGKCREAAGSRNLVVNMSLGGNISSKTENTAFQNAYSTGKVLSVAAAGNDGNTRKSYPASYTSVVSVAAVDAQEVVADFSQKNDAVELSAPGVGVLSTVPFAPSSVTAGGTTYLGENIEGSARTMATGALVDGGLCDSAGSWAGRVVLCQRGSISFADKVNNAKDGGGVAAVIYNNVAGGFAGTLNGSSTIPAISVSDTDGSALVTRAGSSATVDNRGGAGSGYSYYDGTSMATPHVTGVAALVWSNNPAASNAELRSALQSTALDLAPAGKDNATGYGLVQAAAALAALQGGGGGGGGGTGDTTPPVISNVAARITNSKNGSFEITWTTNEPATSDVTLNGTLYSDSTLTTNHRRTFRGAKGATYTYSVASADAAGNRAEAGPFQHKN